ncbi:MAG: AAA family ATPase [Gammaproteobacteria bacterium]|nr:AAA family ATPase [Gammaproteobacteria bacterium]
MTERADLEILLASHYPLVTVTTFEEARTVDLFKDIARRRELPLGCWTVSDGLRGIAGPPLFTADSLRLAGNETAGDGGAAPSSRDPEAALRAIRNNAQAGIYLLLDFHPFLDEPVHVRLIKEIAQDHERVRMKLVFVSHDLALPGELRRFACAFQLSLPNKLELGRIVSEEAAIWNVQGGSRVRADAAAVTALISNLGGLTRSDARRLVRNAIQDDGAITHADVGTVAAAKRELIGQDGLLAFEFDTADLAEVGGFSRLKAWLAQRRQAFVGAAAGHDDRPRGVLLLGVQGGGKSLAAKAVAAAWKVPLLRLDFGVLYNKFFGETERNMREALASAEALAPCVLWCDEIEKGISTGDYDSGTSRRVLGTLLTWMAENRRAVFIVATANDISALPPELVRKGRLDEIFFVDLPDAEVRRSIFAIHLARRGLDPETFDLAALAASSAGMTGAEIEQAVVAARYAAADADAGVTTRSIVTEIEATRPLSVVMAEDLERLRAWADERCVRVD